MFVPVTLATPARLDYRRTEGGDYAADVDGVAVDRIATASLTLDPTLPLLPSASLVEVTPSHADGLPTLSPIHVYRTFRFETPVTALPRAFISTHLTIADEGELDDQQSPE